MSAAVPVRVYDRLVVQSVSARHCAEGYTSMTCSEVESEVAVAQVAVASAYAIVVVVVAAVAAVQSVPSTPGLGTVAYPYPSD